MNLKSMTFNIEIARLGQKYLVRAGEFNSEARTGSSMDQPMIFDNREALQQWLSSLALTLP